MGFVKLNPRKYPVFIIRSASSHERALDLHTSDGEGCVPSSFSDPSLSARPFPSFPRVERYKAETRKSSKHGAVPGNHPGERGSKRHRPPPSRPVSEIKRRGRNLAEGCKYYKVTLRRMRELKGSPRQGKGGSGGGGGTGPSPEDNASEWRGPSRPGPSPFGTVNYVREG